MGVRKTVCERERGREGGIERERREREGDIEREGGGRERERGEGGRERDGGGGGGNGRRERDLPCYPMWVTSFGGGGGGGNRCCCWVRLSSQKITCQLAMAPHTTRPQTATRDHRAAGNPGSSRLSTQHGLAWSHFLPHVRAAVLSAISLSLSLSLSLSSLSLSL